MTLSIFPDFAGKEAAFINLNDCAVAARRPFARSPFLTPRLTDRFLMQVNKKWGVAYTLGGYLEDRRDLWRGSYLPQDSAVHLGIDVNVRAGTDVAVKYPCRVARILHDEDQDGGWGGVIIFELEKPVGAISHFLYAHLARDGVTVREGEVLASGTVVGRIGEHHENGGWYEHLHVQALTRGVWGDAQGDLASFDGYDAHPRRAEHPRFPNPLPLL